MMEKAAALAVFEALSSGIRLDVYRLLVRTGREGLVAGEISAALDLPPTNTSFHLKTLSHAGLVSVEQEGRFQRYRASLPQMRALIAYLTAECCDGMPELCVETVCGDGPGCNIDSNLPRGGATRQAESPMSDKIYNVLFLCSGNSARSIIAEVVLNELGKGRFKAFSAGSQPSGAVHPMTLQVLQAQGYDTSTLRSKSWEEFASADAPQMDFVFTVCDLLAGEACPVWPGQPLTAHWGFADPVKAEGSEQRRLAAFSQVQNQIVNRLRLFLSLPLAKLDRLAIKREIDRLGQVPVDAEG